ncbi:Acetyltransferase component of pyruvate dehydrogenase complex [Thalictrum thalictroides]|uniref:Acetyltransferase component of pyruvate dehydrogenase complex n=1 Tax=Thalictrum thalictroides TaxID=46969 RepID=A0A7J6WID8_THATH|nr:Acetyltransferase component of pyruvate dehydrogenase complex [Thalictrum thalictroides]
MNNLRKQLNSLQEASGGKTISVNDLVIKAAALALRKVPQCNSSFKNVNINVAVQTDNGLYVPVIRTRRDYLCHVKRVVPKTGANQFDFTSFMTVTLSCDHRVIDADGHVCR